MVNFHITFDRTDRTYSPGDVVNLDIRVQVNSGTTFRSIYVRLQGYAHVEWTESRQVTRNGKSHTEHTTYHSHESYFKNYKTLEGTEGGPDMRLAPGAHVYHASFVLPQRLPQNHEDGNGHIRYEAKVHMDVPWGFDNKETVSFNLRPRVNLNEFPQLREPIRSQAHKTFGCCCWESDPLRIYNILPQGAFVPGDRVQYTLELNNDSDVSIDSATVKLVENITYHAYSPSSRTREDGRTLWQHEFSGHTQLVAAMQNKVFTCDLHFNPSWNFNFFDGCDIITVEYYIKATARVSGCHTNLDNHTTIRMGTVPLAYGGTQPAITAPLAPMPMPFPSAPVDNASAPPAEPISEQPLPSYNDTVLKPPQATGIGWSGASNMETPPPSFTEIQFKNEKDKAEKQ